MDIGVLLGRDPLPSVKDRFEEGLRLAGILAGIIGHSRVDLVVLNDAPPGLAASVVTRGRPLCVVDLPAEHAFRRDVQLRAADLEPFLRRTRAIKLQAIGR